MTHPLPSYGPLGQRRRTSENGSDRTASQAPAASVDLRPGGAYEVDMEGPNSWSKKAVYSIGELTVGERLVLEASGGDRAKGNYFRVNMIVEISDRGAQTQLELTGIVMESQPGATGPLTGGEEPWSQSMDRLGELLRKAA